MTEKYNIEIPSVTLNNNNLSASDKLLHGELIRLADDDGYCIVRNEFLADSIGVSTKTISRGISNLKKEGFIDSKIVEQGNTMMRRIEVLNYKEIIDFLKGCEVNER